MFTLFGNVACGGLRHTVCFILVTIYRETDARSKAVFTYDVRLIGPLDGLLGFVYDLHVNLYTD